MEKFHKRIIFPQNKNSDTHNFYSFLLLGKITLVTILLISNINSVKSQSIDSIFITKTYKETPIINILDEFKNTYDLNIYYKLEWFEEDVYTGTFKQAQILSALSRIFEKTKLTYLNIDANIYVVPKENIALILKKMTDRNESHNLMKDYVIIGNENESGKYKTVRITGLVSDGATGDVLVGSKIIVENTKYYAITGYTGKYVLEVPTGIYLLKFVSMGFEDKFIDIKAISPGPLNIEMFEESHAINEVIISSERTNKNITRSQMSVLELSAKSIKLLPASIGEPDIIKSFASMPGVKSVSEFGSGINVRGGSEDQNLFLLENAPIYNTSHVMGLLSVINPDAVSKVSLYKGHIPIEYGERVSSVMDIKIDDPKVDKFKLKGGIGIYSSRLLLETPLFNKLVKLKLGARSSYSDFLLKKMPDYNLQNSSARFGDLTGTININLRNNPITLFSYYSNDYFKYASDYSYKYGNKLLSLAWTHIFNSELSCNILGAYSRYNLYNENKLTDLFAYKAKSMIESKSAKLRFEYSGLNKQALQAGFKGIHYNINPGDKEPLEFSQEKPFNTEDEKGYELSVFIGDDITINSQLSFSIGLRFTYFNNLGPNKVYTYKDNTPRIFDNLIDSSIYANGKSVINYSSIEPRASVKYLVDEANSIKASYNRNVQYLALISYTSITTPEDTWKLADPNIKPIIADQIALGYYHNFDNNNIETSVELYAKQLQNLTEYRNNATLQFNNHIETELLNAKGTNYGIEFLIKKKNGKLNGSISYTYSRAWKQTSGKWSSDMINNNKHYPSQYDVPHELNINTNYKVNRRVRFGANFSYATGRPVTLPEYTYPVPVGNNKLIEYSKRNKYRLPNYHRLDFSVSVDESLKKNKKWKGSWTFSILNIYARKNAYSIFYQKDTPTPKNNYEAFSLYKMYLIGIPMPTITYNFIF